MLEASQACVDDYSSYFSFSKNRSGYSGKKLIQIELINKSNWITVCLYFV